MSEPCKVCGEDPDMCLTQRREFAREPWLPGGFELGAQWYSYDNGLTWTRHPFKASPSALGKSMTVTAIDAKTGTVTVKVG